MAEEDDVLFGGAKGPGKSTALVVLCFLYAMKYPTSSSVLFRETYDDLEANLISEWKRWVPKALYEYNESKHTAVMKNGSIVRFRYIRNYDDAKHYDGRSFDFIGVDELTHFLEEWIQILRSCLRSAKGFPTYFRATSNPGNIGHAAVKNRYIKPTDYGKNIVDSPESNDKIKIKVRFIPANVYDGVLTDMDPAYVLRLENLPEQDRQAYLDGNWDIAQGQYFSGFRAGAMRREPYYLHDGAYLYGSLDHGTTAPTSFGLWTVTGDKIPIRLFSYYKGKTVTSVNAVSVAMAVKSFKWSHGRPPRIVFCDPSMWTRSRMEEGFQPAPIEYYEKAFEQEFMGFTEYKTVFVKANNDIRSGCAIMREYIREHDGVPLLQYFNISQNKGFEEHIPAIQHDKNDPEIYDSTGEDHDVDDTRYLLMGIHGNDEMTPAAKTRTSATMNFNAGNRYSGMMHEVSMS